MGLKKYWFRTFFLALGTELWKKASGC